MTIKYPHVKIILQHTHTHTQVRVLNVRPDDKLIALISETYLQTHQPGGRLRIARIFHRAPRSVSPRASGNDPRPAAD